MRRKLLAEICEGLGFSSEALGADALMAGCHFLVPVFTIADILTSFLGGIGVIMILERCYTTTVQQ
jgi:hypothetical protein